MQSPSTPLRCQYHYDVLDRLVANAPSNEPTRQQFYCESRLATEIHGAIGYSIIQHGDQLLAQQQIQGGACETSLLTSDQQRSVLDTVGANHPRQPVAYTPYGQRPAGGGLLSLLGFKGELPDPVTGCYLLGNGYRPFNPVLMIFTSPDNLSPFGNGGLNPYCYCLGDPINLSDPSGHAPFMKVISSTLTFKKLASGSKTIAHIERNTTTISTLISNKTVRRTGAIFSNTEIFSEAGVQNIATYDDGITTTFQQSNKPSFIYPSKPSLQDLAYTAVRPSDLDPITRRVVSGMRPLTTDIRNAGNYLTEVEFDLKKIGVYGAERARQSRAIKNYNLKMGNIRGAFPEKM